MKTRSTLLLAVLFLTTLAACYPPAGPVPPTPNPDVYNQAPDTTVYEAGQCAAVLDAPAPSFTSNTLSGAPSGEVPAGTYDVGVVADYGSVVFYQLANASEPNWVNSASVASLSGSCATDNPLAGTQWQVTDYADPRNTTGMTTVLPDTTLTADFGADGVIGGSAGCNTYSGTYQVDGQALTIPGPLATTMMACADDVMAQETVFLTNLQNVAGYKIDSVEPQLHLLNGKGQVVILLKQQ